MTSATKSSATPNLTTGGIVDGAQIDASDVTTPFGEVNTLMDTVVQYVSVSSSDTYVGHLDDKLVVGAGLTKTILNPSGNAQIQLSASAATLVDQCNGRLTLTSNTPVTTSDVSGASATTLYYTPFKGNQISLYDGSSAWATLSFSQISLSLSGYALNRPYDIWAYNNAGSVALESTAWTNDLNRATALTTQDGVYVKSGATTRRYLGTIRTTGVSGQCADTVSQRFVYNYYNRVRRYFYRTDGTVSWAYGTATWRSSNNSTSNRVEWVTGAVEDAVQVNFRQYMVLSSGFMYIGLGLDSTSVPTAEAWSGASSMIAVTYDILPTVGYHYMQALEYSTASNTYYGGNSYRMDGGLWC